MNKSTNSAAGKSGKVAGAGLLVAISASLCCITPVLALVSGTSGFASMFSFMEPIRPYLIAITVLVLGFAWYQKLIPKAIGTRTAEEIQCDCEEEQKKPFMHTKTFLGIVTAFAALMLAFPNYAHIFYPKTEKQIVVVAATNIKEVKFQVSGMTCSGCEEHVKHAVNELPGILDVTANYEEGTAIVKFDESKTNRETIVSTIDQTGYKVVAEK